MQIEIRVSSAEWLVLRRFAVKTGFKPFMKWVRHREHLWHARARYASKALPDWQINIPPIWMFKLFYWLKGKKAYLQIVFMLFITKLYLRIRYGKNHVILTFNDSSGYAVYTCDEFEKEFGYSPNEDSF